MTLPLVLLLGTVVVAPLLVGGALPSLELGLGAMGLAAFMAAAGRSLRRHGGIAREPIGEVLLLGGMITALQLLPLPQAVVGWLSPETLAQRSDALGSTPDWLPLTLDVPATAAALGRALVGAGVYLTAASVAQRASRARLGLAAVALTGAAIAGLAVLQRALHADKILWLYRPDWSPTFVGTFVNPNHAAALFGLALCLGLGLTGERGRWRHVGGLVALLCLLGLGLTASRGGLIIFAAASLMLLVGILAPRLGPLLGGLIAAVLGVAALALLLLGNEQAMHRFAQIDLHYLTHNQKVVGWRDTLVLCRDYFWAGVGRGAFMAPFQRYRSIEDGAALTHPENLLLQLSAEWGVPLTVLLLALGLRALWRVRTRLQGLGLLERSAFVGVAAVGVQNMVDFGLELLGVALPCAAVLGMAMARASADTVEARPLRWRARPLLALGALWLVGLAAASWALPRDLRTDDARLTALVRAGAPLPTIESFAAAAIARHPCDYHLELLRGIAHVRAGDTAALRPLNRVLRLRPGDVDAHHLAALTLARAGRLAQAALEYRTAFTGGLAMSPSHLDEVLALGAAGTDAVPQTVAALLAYARHVSRHTAALAQRALERARTLDPADERVSRLEVQLATEAADPVWLLRAAQTLEAMMATPEAALVVALAYRAAGRLDQTRRSLLRSSERFADDAALGLALARLELETHQLDAARRALASLPEHNRTLETRRQVELVRAEIAEQAGDHEAAQAARRRAGLFERALRAAGATSDAAATAP